MRIGHAVSSDDRGTIGEGIRGLMARRTKATATPADLRLSAPNGPLRTRRADPDAWRAGLAAVGGVQNADRLEIHDDGSVTVHNKPIR